jgi:hypothetical protein
MYLPFILLLPVLIFCEGVFAGVWMMGCVHFVPQPASLLSLRIFRICFIIIPACLGCRSPRINPPAAAAGRRRRRRPPSDTFILILIG